MYGPNVVLLTKIKSEYSDILYNPTHFPGPFVCRMRQVPQHIYIYKYICVCVIQRQKVEYTK